MGKAPEAARRHGAALARAREAVSRDPGDAEALVWVGRQTAYLGRVREAVEVFGRGAERFPEDARFLRHRGHRWLTLRQLGRATLDLTRARALIAGRPDEVEPDGLPNARGVPVSTLGSNVRYHLGLARYLAGEWAAAEEVLAEEVRLAAGPAGNPDRLVAASWWLVLALHRQGRGAEAAPLLAAIGPDLDLIENEGYRRLLLLFATGADAAGIERDAQGATVEAVTLAYGLGAWHLARGRRDAAEAVWRGAVARGPWMAFGRLAAEAGRAGPARALSRIRAG